MAQDFANCDRPVRKGYYEVFSQNDKLCICGPDIEKGNFVVTGMTLIQGDIYDVSYCTSGQMDDVKIMRCHIIAKC